MTALPLNAWLVPLVAAFLAAGLAVFLLLRPWAEAFHRRGGAGGGRGGGGGGAGAGAGAAGVGAAGEPGSVPVPDQVRDPGALRARRLRAVRDVADAPARGVARAPRALGRDRLARVGGAHRLRARAHAARADARARVGVVTGALRLVHAARGGPL